MSQVPVVRANPEKKAFLGGYRSRKVPSPPHEGRAMPPARVRPPAWPTVLRAPSQTHTVYHHASSQTDPPPRNHEDHTPKFHRETQTAVLQTRSQQSVREQGTQMPSGHLAMEEGDEVRVRPPASHG